MAVHSMLVCLLACALAVLKTGVAQTDDVIVYIQPEQGVSGISTEVDQDGRTVYVDTFYGIPYAKSPIGDLRFSKPLPPEPWTGVRNGSNPGPHCTQPQYLIITNLGQEDCLYLNIHAPKKKSPEAQPGYPVMVFIHGGAFFVGAGDMFDGVQLAARGVVTVTVNYRLGALGFLSTQDAVSPGNYGLYDVILALRWVQDNVAKFGGNPNAVTIFGESAGAAMTSLLYVSNQTEGLFHHAIMESGVALAPWAVGQPTTEPQPLKGATSLASKLGCPTDDHTRLLACLRTKEAHTIVEKQMDIEFENKIRLTFKPVAEGMFSQPGLFSASPEVMLKAASFNNVTVIRGFNKNEGAIGLETLDPTDEGMSLEKFTNLTTAYVKRAVLAVYPLLDEDAVMSLVLETYVTKPRITDPRQLRDVHIQIITDFEYFAPTYLEMLLHDKGHGSTEYQYHFSFRSQNRLVPQYMGVPHSDELFYVFGYPLNGLTLLPNFVSNWTNEDRAMTQRVMQWWTDFARSGNPTPQGSMLPKWLPWTKTTPRYLDINRQSAMADASQSPGMLLWNVVIPGLNPSSSTSALLSVLHPVPAIISLGLSLLFIM